MDYTYIIYTLSSALAMQTLHEQVHIIHASRFKGVEPPLLMVRKRLGFYVCSAFARNSFLMICSISFVARFRLAL